jgi:hypothetical protein
MNNRLTFLLKYNKLQRNLRKGLNFLLIAKTIDIRSKLNYNSIIKIIKNKEVYMIYKKWKANKNQ